MSGHNGMKAHCVVQSRFDVPCSMRRCAVEIRDTDGDRFYAAFEVGAYRRGKYTELIFICRLYSDDRVDSEHIRSDI